MKIALISPRTHTLQHRVRGSGFYIENLKNSLLKFDKKNKYIFPQEESLPSDVDLVHYPYFEPFFLTLPLFKKTKIVVTVHDLTPFVFPKYFPKGVKGALKWQIQKRSLKNADAIITDSSSSKNDIVKFAGIRDEKVHRVYLASGEEFKKLKIENLKFKIQRKYNLPSKFALYVGDVTWNKNLPRLISAAKEVNITLLMVGSALSQKDFDKSNPWNQDLLKVRQMAKDDKRIITLGFIDKEDLVTLYNLAAVFVMPSLYEGFGLPILEAMSSGCPVITSKEGSIPEIAGDAVYYVDPYNVSDIANGIGEVYFNNDLAGKLSEKGLLQAKKFSWEKTAKETIKVYESI